MIYVVYYGRFLIGNEVYRIYSIIREHLKKLVIWTNGVRIVNGGKLFEVLITFHCIRYCEINKRFSYALYDASYRKWCT